MQSKEDSAARRITLKLGNSLTRKVVLLTPPFPKAGDEMTIQGEGARWRVAGVRKATRTRDGRLPAGKARVSR